MKCVLCENEEVITVGRVNHCNQCGITWKDPIYKKTLNPVNTPLFIETLKDLTHSLRLPWLLVAILTTLCIYLYTLINPLQGVI